MTEGKFVPGNVRKALGQYLLAQKAELEALQAKVLKYEQALILIDRQLVCSDGYAREARGDKPLTSVWEIQNKHIKDIITEVRQ